MHGRPTQRCRGQFGVTGFGLQPVRVNVALLGPALIALVLGHPPGQMRELGRSGEEFAADCGR